jgi:hypothetical protein
MDHSGLFLNAHCSGKSELSFFLSVIFFVLFHRGRGLVSSSGIYSEWHNWIQPVKSKEIE